MKYFTIRDQLPDFITNPLFGKRKKFGLEVQADDSCWQEWLNTYSSFYAANQRKGIGTLVNDAGYRIMAQLNMSGQIVLEIGGGDIRHLDYWIGMPQEYILTDIHSDMLIMAENRLNERGIKSKSVLISPQQPLPFDDSSVDVVVSFYSLEHLYPLRPYLEDIRRVLKPGGVLIGAIPAEGGLAWGMGRFVTSRRWLKKNTTINPDKIICWEHPNFAEEILFELDTMFCRNKLSFWPLPTQVIDVNLVIRYVYHKS